MSWRLIRCGLVLAMFLLVQSVLVLQLRLGAAHPEVVLLLPILAGLINGIQTGAAMGFVAGLAEDLLLPTPFGLTALVGCIVGACCGILAERRSTISDVTQWWLAPGVALTASAAAVMLYAVLGALLGQEQMLHVDLVHVVVVVALTNAVLAIPARPVVAWALGAQEGRRRGVRMESRW
jgi:rod shape-determining protein MreD